MCWVGGLLSFNDRLCALFGHADEIYACSIFGDDMPQFQSAWDLAPTLVRKAPFLVHFSY